MKRLSLLVFVMMVTWIVASCSTTTTSKGCFGFEVSNKWGLQRGTIVGKNTNYTKPYRQCVEKDAPHRNTEKRTYE